MSTTKMRATRYHDISCGHRVHGHESKCRHMHGHNYRIHFTCQAQPHIFATDNIGRVIDFGEIKAKLCMWVENNWDHKFLAWDQDPVMHALQDHLRFEDDEAEAIFDGSLVWVPFNPTAENMAEYLVHVVGPQMLTDTGVRLVRVDIEETAKCSVSYEVE